MISFPFVEFFSENLGIVKRPFAKVKLITSDSEVILPMLIDSGADVSIISYERGLKLGFKLSQDEKIYTLGGISGGISVVYRNLQMEIGELIFDAKVAWSLAEDVAEILGRLNVFEIFDIELKQAEKLVIFKKRQQ